jgi:hypothetical protein
MARRRYRRNPHRRHYRRNPDDSTILVLGALGIGAFWLMSQQSATAATAAAAATPGGQVASVLTAGSSLANALSNF